MRCGALVQLDHLTAVSEGQYERPCNAPIKQGGPCVAIVNGKPCGELPGELRDYPGYHDYTPGYVHNDFRIDKDHKARV